MSTKNVFVAITGRANAGKSSLTNLLVGEKVAIVSDKPQTTRTRINGVLTKGETQFVFIDTPGMHKAKTRLSEHMVKSIKDSVSDVEVAILMTDVTRKISPIEEELISSFKTRNCDVILLLNKIDLVKDKTEILKVIENYSKLHEFADIIPISVVKRINTDQIMPVIEKYAVEGPHFFPDDITTDQTERIMAAEIVREKILYQMHEEIPHGIAVEIESYDKRNNGKKEIIDLGVVIICEKASHKGMIIGKGGEKLKVIASTARKELESFFGTSVNMTCWVKVKEDWRNRDSLINSYGLGSE